ncbi:MAG: hypothetical protein KKB03_02365 [Nanoarchaeota archaeon]|nr:hypothetical protein [Nanoarchaeota archaeon]MBU1135008.1 hypothetical protein [Nanoarchaeota archaeon]MBU2520063.1 hypothetical protein [Nanoarchaeota archaeon]
MARLEGIERYPPKEGGFKNRESYTVEFPDNTKFGIYKNRHIRVVLDSYEENIKLYDNYANLITGDAEEFAINLNNRSGSFNL